MKKIMFNDRFGLTDDVLAGHKTMTRRLIGQCDRVEPYFGKDGYCLCNIFNEDIYVGTVKSRYHIGEEVAVAQSYKELAKIDDYYNCEQAKRQAGWSNKMFVRANLMQYHIKIKDIKVERLCAINDEDCRKEGIVPFTWRQWLKQDIGDFGPQRYKDWSVWTLPKFLDSLSYHTDESDPDEYMATSPRAAFAVLILKLMGTKTWERNPYVFAYEFELVK